MSRDSAKAAFRGRMNTEPPSVGYIHHPLTPDRFRRPVAAFHQNAFHAKGDIPARIDAAQNTPPPPSHTALQNTVDGIMFQAPTGEFFRTAGGGVF